MKRRRDAKDASVVNASGGSKSKGVSKARSARGERTPKLSGVPCDGQMIWMSWVRLVTLDQ